MNKEPYIFISYSSKDAAFADVIINLLNQMHVAYWKAPEMIPAGSSYAKEIVSALRNCSFMLLILSANSQQSQWVEKEIDSAVNYNRRIIPLLIDDTPVNDVFRFYLNNVQMIYYKQDPKAALDEVRDYIRHLSKAAAPIDKKARFLRSGRTPAANTATNTAAKPKPVPVRTARPKPAIAKPAEKSAPKAAQPQSRPKKQMRTVDFSSMNRRPVTCQYCGGELNDVGGGIYRCLECALENYDDFTAIRRYLDQNGPVPVTVISRELDIPRQIVNNFRDLNHM